MLTGVAVWGVEVNGAAWMASRAHRRWPSPNLCSRAEAPVGGGRHIDEGSQIEARPARRAPPSLCRIDTHSRGGYQGPRTCRPSSDTHGQKGIRWHDPMTRIRAGERPCSRRRTRRRRWQRCGKGSDHVPMPSFGASARVGVSDGPSRDRNAARGGAEHPLGGDPGGRNVEPSSDTVDRQLFGIAAFWRELPAPGTPESIECFDVRGSGVVRGLGRVSLSSVQFVDTAPQGCLPGSFGVVGGPLRLSVVGKGTIEMRPARTKDAGH